jgi:transcriptional regulator with XRE-family HTH domain
MGGKKRAAERERPDKSDPVYVLGEVIRDLRTSKDLSQRDLAALTEVERSTIAYVELGTRSPSVATLFELSRALGVRASDLLMEVERRLAAG